MTYVQKYAICMMYVGGMWASHPTMSSFFCITELIIIHIRYKKEEIPLTFHLSTIQGNKYEQ